MKDIKFGMALAVFDEINYKNEYLNEHTYLDQKYKQEHAESFWIVQTVEKLWSKKKENLKK